MIQMVIRVNLLIYLYTMLCGCVLVFDLFYAVRKRWRQKAEPERMDQYRKILLPLLQQEPSSLSEKELKKWSSKLSRAANLLCFHEAAENLLEDPEHRGDMERWLQSNKDLFLVLGHRYVGKSEPFYATFFAYLVWKYRLCTEKETDPFVMMMLKLCLSHSLYCRENALCALYGCGCPEHVAKAYVLMTQHGVEHSAKLVTDGLLQFAGDKNELAEQLWSRWDMFLPHYQVCIVNYIRMVSGNFCERFYKLLSDGQADNEVLFAAIRYFRTYPYGEAEGFLQNLVVKWDEADWEFAAIAALSLEKYHGSATMQALLTGCRSTSWHVRENASDSLIQMMSDDALQSLIAMEGDRFAREMLLYKLTKRRRERAK